MALIRTTLSPAVRNPVVRGVRRAFGRLGAPGLNPELESLHRGVLELSTRHDALAATVRELELHIPTVLNAIASTHGTARLLRRELDATAARVERNEQWLALQAERVEVLTKATEDLDAHRRRLDGHVTDELWPLKATVEWLLERVEMVRAEALFEARYGAGHTESGEPVVEIVNPDAVKAEGPLRLNLGCGHIALDGYVNVDMRALPGVDVVAPIDGLPFEQGSVAEVFSAHVLEHFPQEQLRRRLLPYWRSLLEPGGVFRAVVPDLEAMTEQLQSGQITFENFRQVAYGGQEYDGDFHFTAFTPGSLSDLLAEAGFVDPQLVERGRPNGDCLEFELTARNKA